MIYLAIAEYGRAEMEQWWNEHDLLPDQLEQIIPASMTAEAAAGQIMRQSGLAS